MSWHDVHFHRAKFHGKPGLVECFNVLAKRFNNMIGISVIDSRKIYRHACILQQFIHSTCTITDLLASGGTVEKTITS